MTFFLKVAKQNGKKFINRSTNIRKYARLFRMPSDNVIYAHQIPCPRKTGAASPGPCPCGWTASSCSLFSSGQTQPLHWSTKIGHLNCIFLHTIRNYCTVAYVSLYCLGVRYPSAYAGLSSLKNFIYASISSGTFSPCR